MKYWRFVKECINGYLSRKRSRYSIIIKPEGYLGMGLWDNDCCWNEACYLDQLLAAIPWMCSDRFDMYVLHIISLTVVCLKKLSSGCVILIIWSYSLHLDPNFILQHSVDFHVSLSTPSNALELI